tara:strand:+ start:93 stop:446 length:354 start_codon:yes stop_codon:yes gene_type:complete
MSDVYRNSSVVLTNSNQTTVYTVPTADASIVPKQKPVQAVVSSIRACNKSGGALTLTLVYTDASLGANVTIINALSIASNTAVELLDRSFVLENSDALKATSSGTGMDIIVSVLEIS